MSHHQMNWKLHLLLGLPNQARLSMNSHISLIDFYTYVLHPSKTLKHHTQPVYDGFMASSADTDKVSSYQNVPQPILQMQGI